MGMMSSPLLQSKLEKCAFMTKSVALDTRGGYKVTWTQSEAQFDAIITEDTTVDAVVAGLEHATTFYGVKIDVNVPLEFLDVFKRLSDGKLFKVRALEGMDAPNISAMGMKMRSAEEFTAVET